MVAGTDESETAVGIVPDGLAMKTGCPQSLEFSSQSQQKKLMVCQSNYIPWKGFFDAINIVDEFIIYDDMQYTRRDWRNRNKIKTAQGVRWLSIPVQVAGKYSQKINETLVSDKEWAARHWRTIQSNYSRSPYSSDYSQIFEALYAQADGLMHLSSINFLFIRAICDILRIKTRITWSSDYTLSGTRNRRLVDLCKQARATHYYSGPSAKCYLDEELFTDKGFTVRYFDYSDYPVYRQRFGPFEHAVSIIDLLFNEGPEATKYMKTFGA